MNKKEAILRSCLIVLVTSITFLILVQLYGTPEAKNDFKSVLGSTLFADFVMIPFIAFGLTLD